MKEILDRNNPILREIAKEVTLEEIQSNEIKAVIRDMKEALAGQEDGVAIAAPQIGVSKRIFVVSGRAISMAKNTEDKNEDVVFINPHILKLSRKADWMEEGCLSVRYLYGKVKRSEKVTITALDENGTAFEMGSSGLLAQIFQHETDHLDGVLFIDKARDVQDIPPANHE